MRTVVLMLAPGRLYVPSVLSEVQRAVVPPLKAAPVYGAVFTAPFSLNVPLFLRLTPVIPKLVKA